MFSHPIPRKCLLISSAVLFFSLHLHSQANEKQLYKKYTLADSSALHTSAVLLFYTDNTFINFGIFNNKKELDLFVWYKSGTWKETGSGIECQSVQKVIPSEDLKKTIKSYYKTHRDRVLIESYYEFVQERYQQGTLLVGSEKASDTEKKIDYQEIKF